MRAEFISHVGAVRENNEDAIFCDPAASLFVVADGIGGGEAGEVASATAVRVVAEKFWEFPDADPAELMREAFYQANDILHRTGRKEGLHGMGTTMTAAVVVGDIIHLVHVGDSRAYLFNDEEIDQLTTDHTLANALLCDGQIDEDELENHPQRHILVRSLGQDVLVQVDELQVAWKKGDFLLLCSDGLYSLLTPAEIQAIALRAASLKNAIDMMVKTAYKRGGFDNISVVLASYE